MKLFGTHVVFSYKKQIILASAWMFPNISSNPTLKFFLNLKTSNNNNTQD